MISGKSCMIHTFSLLWLLHGTSGIVIDNQCGNHVTFPKSHITNTLLAPSKFACSLNGKQKQTIIPDESTC